jgi:hypothetical protein
MLAAGYHVLRWIQYGNGSGTQSWFPGANGGMIGEVQG